MEAFHTKYRPQTFEDVVEQSSITRILNRQIETDRVGSAYLFAGPSGCGKTTLAYILANAVDGELIEVDVASNNSVESTRSIVESASTRSVMKKRKVFLLDECQMYSNAAWQPFLKELEKESKYTVFIFCTTDPQKIPQTILTRVQRFNLTRVSNVGIQNRLRYICQQEGLEDYESGIEYLSRIAGGSPRQAISLLEKCSGYSIQISLENVLAALGGYSYELFFSLLDACIDGNEGEVLRVLSTADLASMDPRLFVDQFISFCLDVNKFAIFNDCSLTQLPTTLTEHLKHSTGISNASAYYSTYLLPRLLELKNMLKTDTAPRDTVEVVFLRITRCI